ncbi:SDR family oxidoreductase [Inconstantimicrobium mannanitabidum]|uniref:NAD(P)-dependent oxidoreductase n=1 Tax=Inconstantimicrobium mannanitabidum TaxID=1604901 RepID=A0ACB5RDH7_9CLOT|nr:NAD(P)-dependent oxidoreductase [Clostridium sp. TW13]GKX66857.1 NAD(P)-dependent oxidoreductase [Clostridium sp. TW13]
MKILILGGKGNIGGFLSKDLEPYHDIISVSKDDLDITSKSSVFSIISSKAPSIVIDAAGISNIDYCQANEQISYSVNTLGTMNIALACSKLDIPLVYISSAQVYGSDNTNVHSEHENCNPINIFGKSKLAGENLIRTLCKKYFILRTSWCFGGEKCFVKSILSKRNTPIFMVADMVVNPTYVQDLSRAILSIIDSTSYGVYNCVNKGETSKCDLVKYIFDLLGYDKKIISLPKSTMDSLAPRPKNCSLANNLIEKSFNLEIPSWEESMNIYLNGLIDKNIL